MLIIELCSEPYSTYIRPYYEHYDKGVKRIYQNKVLKQLLTNWDDTVKWLMIYRQFDIDTNPMMEIITKIFFYVYRTNKQIIADKKAEQKQQRTRQHRLYTRAISKRL